MVYYPRYRWISKLESVTDTKKLQGFNKHKRSSNDEVIPSDKVTNDEVASAGNRTPIKRLNRLKPADILKEKPSPK